MVNIGCCSLILNHSTRQVLALQDSKNRGYVLPGGKWIKGETFHQCAARELFEETTLSVITSRLLFAGMNTDDYFVYCFLTRASGIPKPSREGHPIYVPWDTLLHNSEFSPYYLLVKEAFDMHHKFGDYSLLQPMVAGEK